MVAQVGKRGGWLREGQAIGRARLGNGRLRDDDAAQRANANGELRMKPAKQSRRKRLRR